MKRLVPAAVIFVMIIIACVISNISVCKSVDKARAEIANCQRLYADNEFEKAYNIALSFKKKWKKRTHLVSVYSNHCPLDDISVLSAILPEAIKYQNDFEVTSAINQIRVALDTVLDEQTFTIDSLY